MKRILSIFLAIVLTTALFTSCGKSEPEPENKVNMEPQISQMKSICELAVMDCYYHNVAKYLEEDAAGFLWWKKDKRFWIEYSGVVTLGIDVSRVTIEVNDKNITITMPEAEVQDCKVDSSSLTAESYIVDADSAKIEAADEIFAFREAQEKLEETAKNNKALLAEAQERAELLLEDYIANINSALNHENKYTITWIYIDADGNQIGTSTSNPVAEV